MKKASASIIILVVIFVIFLVGIISLVIYGYSSGWFEKKEKEKTEEEPTITLFLEPIDSVTKEGLTANFTVFSNTGFIEEGITEKETPRSLVVPILEEINKYNIYFWNEDHYLQYCPAIVSKKEKDKILRVTCELLKFGDINVNHKGSIDNESITLNLSSKDHLRRLGICLSWTSGIVNAKLKENKIVCEKGQWLNYSCYYPPNETSKKPYYCWLPENIFRCNYKKYGEEWQQETCESLYQNYCIPPEMPYGREPNRLKNEVDICYNTGRSLLNSTEIFEIEVKNTELLDCMDSLKILIIDKERYWNGNDYVFGYEDNLNKNIGMEDIEHILKPEGC